MIGPLRYIPDTPNSPVSPQLKKVKHLNKQTGKKFELPPLAILIPLPRILEGEEKRPSSKQSSIQWCRISLLPTFPFVPHPVIAPSSFFLLLPPRAGGPRRGGNQLGSSPPPPPFECGGGANPPLDISVCHFCRRRLLHMRSSGGGRDIPPGRVAY